MIENEMQNIKEKFGKNVKFILITAIIVSLISFVGLLYFYSPEIIQAIAKTTNPTKWAMLSDKIKEVLANVYKIREFGRVTDLDSAQIAAASDFALANVDLVINLMKIFLSFINAIADVIIAGGIITLVAMKKENLKLMKMARIFLVAGIGTLTLLSLVLIFVLMFACKTILPISGVFYVGGSLLVFLSMCAVLSMFLVKTLSFELKKLFNIIITLVTILGMVLTGVGLVLCVLASREDVTAFLSSVDLLFLIFTICGGFGVFSLSSILLHLTPLEKDNNSNELYANLKSYAQTIVREKEEKLRKKALR